MPFCCFACCDDNGFGPSFIGKKSKCIGQFHSSIEHNTPRLSACDKPHRKGRIIRKCGASADKNCIVFCSKDMHECSGSFGSDPLGLAILESTSAIER